MFFYMVQVIVDGDQFDRQLKTSGRGHHHRKRCYAEHAYDTKTKIIRILDRGGSTDTGDMGGCGGWEVEPKGKKMATLS
jgi:hypothetical protein